MLRPSRRSVIHLKRWCRSACSCHDSQPSPWRGHVPPETPAVACLGHPLRSVSKSGKKASTIHNEIVPQLWTKIHLDHRMAANVAEGAVPSSKKSSASASEHRRRGGHRLVPPALYCGRACGMTDQSDPASDGCRYPPPSGFAASRSVGLTMSPSILLTCGTCRSNSTLASSLDMPSYIGFPTKRTSVSISKPLWVVRVANGRAGGR